MYHIDTEYTMRGKPYARGDMHRKFSKALGNQCQCDGNCRCGYIKHHRLHCGNCGWNTPYSYNALTDKFTCPSCKTETCINLKKSDIDMSNYIDPSGESPFVDPSGESPFSQGVVGTGIGNDGFLLWSKDPLGDKYKNPSLESNFDQNTVAYAIGEQGMSLQPFSEQTLLTGMKGSQIESSFDQNTVAYAIGEQGMSLQPFSTPITSGDKQIESAFDQNTVAYAIGEQGLSLDPFTQSPISTFEKDLAKPPVDLASNKIENSMLKSQLGAMKSKLSSGDKTKNWVMIAVVVGILVVGSMLLIGKKNY